MTLQGEKLHGDKLHDGKPHDDELHGDEETGGAMIYDKPIDADGRWRIGELVRAAMGWAGVSGPKLVGTGRVSKATIDRAKAGADVSDTMLRALGDVLGMPRDFLLYVGYGDTKRIKGVGESDPDLVRWTLDHLFPASRPPTVSGTRKAKSG